MGVGALELECFIYDLLLLALNDFSLSYQPLTIRAPRRMFGDRRRVVKRAAVEGKKVDVAVAKGVIAVGQPGKLPWLIAQPLSLFIPGAVVAVEVGGNLVFGQTLEVIQKSAGVSVAHPRAAPAYVGVEVEPQQLTHGPTRLHQGAVKLGQIVIVVVARHCQKRKAKQHVVKGNLVGAIAPHQPLPVGLNEVLRVLLARADLVDHIARVQQKPAVLQVGHHLLGNAPLGVVIGVWARAAVANHQKRKFCIAAAAVV